MGPHYTRVAVVQIAYHPAIVANLRSPLEDPLWDPKRGDSLVPAHGQVPDALQPDLEALRKRIRAAYDEQLLAKVQAILATCRQHDVRLVVFPEYSIPWEILGGVADAAGDMVVVAGTHTVERSGRNRDKVYKRLDAPSLPAIGQSVCPVLHKGRLLALVSKLNPAEPERGSMTPGEMWAPIAMPDGLPGPMGVLICLDFLFRESDLTKKIVSNGLDTCRFLAVPSLTPHHTTSEFAAKAWEEARRYGRPVLYCDIANGGGTAFYVDEGAPSDLRQFPERAGYLDPGDEGVIIADVNLGYERTGASTRYDSLRQVKPVAEATLVYRTNPTSAAYAQWLDDIAPVLARNDDDTLEDLITRIEGDRQILLNAGALSGAKARDRRLRKLVHSTDKLTSVEQIRQLLGEVVLPQNVLPLDAVGNAMTGAAADVVFEWLKRREAKAAEFGDVEERLRKASETGKSQSWTPEALSVMAAIAEAVRGPQEPETPKEAPAPEVKVVLPKGIDPATLGEQEAGGFKFAFRRRASDFQPARVDHAKVGDVWSATVSAPFLEAEIWAAEGFCQLATAEGAERVAVLGVATVDPSGPRGLLALSSRGDGWVLWSGNIASSLREHRDAIVAALRGLGLPIVATEHLTVGEQGERVRALLPIMDGAKPALQQLRNRRLEEVNGQFEEPFARVDGNAQTPALGALNEWLDSGWQAALVLGEFGSGKSTVLAVWAEQQWNRESGPKPILVDLAGALPGRDPESLLLDTVGVSDTPVHRAALRLLIRYRFVVACFDGFDEIATRLGATELEGRLSALFDAARGGPGQVLVSCRSNYFATEKHLSNTTQRALQSVGITGQARRIELVLFNSTQVEHLVRRICSEPESAELALKKIANTYHLQDLVQRPLLLGMVVRSLGELDASSRIGIADLYEAYLTRWLRQTNSGDPECFTDEQKIEFGEALADQLWRSGSFSCSWEELHESVVRRLSPLVRKLELRYEPAFQEIQGGAFFVREGDDRFRFAHRSFLEYFLARGICRTITARPEAVLSTKPISREVATFVGDILRRNGDPKLGNEVRSVQQFLLSGRTNALESTAEAGANALRLLHGLAKWSAEAAGWIPEGANLQKVSLVRADLRDVVLIRAKLSGADLSCADLSGADLTNAGLEKARFAATKLFGTRLVRVNARGADFLQAEADKTNLDGADLRDANLRQSMWTRCRWEGARFDGADVTLWAAPGATGLPSHVQPLQLSAKSSRAYLPTLPSGEISVAAWTADKTQIALGYENGYILIVNLMSCSITLQLQSAWGDIQAIAWSRDGILLAVSAPGNIDIWHVRTGALLVEMALPNVNVAALCWSPDGSSIAGGCQDGMVRVWNAQDGKESSAFGKHLGNVTAIDWEPDGTRIATGGQDGQVQLWDIRTGQGGAIRRGHIGTVSTVRWSPRATMIASAGADAILRIWNPDTRMEVAQLFDHSRPITAVSWADEDRIASAASDGNVIVWSAQRSIALVGGRDNWHGLLEDWQAFIAIQWATESERIFTLNRSGGFYSWNALNGAREMNPVSFERSRCPSIAWNPLDARLACGTSKTSIWDTQTGQVLRQIRGYVVGNESLVCWHRDGVRLLIGSKDVGEISLVDAESGEIHSTFQTWAAPLTAVDWLSDGNTFVTAAIDGNISIWSLNNEPENLNPSMVLVGGVPQRQPAFRRPVKTLSVTPLRTSALSAHPTVPLIAFGGIEGGVFLNRLEDTAIDEPLFMDGEAPNGIVALNWSPDGSMLAAASMINHVYLASEPVRKKLASTQIHASAIAWHPSGEILAISGYDESTRATLALKHISDFESTVVLSSDTFGNASLTWSSNGKRLAEASDDHGVRIWDVENRTPLATFQETSSLSWMARTPDGFCVFNDPTGLSLRLAIDDPRPEAAAEFYLPLAGLREIVHRQDKVAAALAGDLSGDDLNAELERVGFAGGVAWDGEEHWVPDALSQAAEPTKQPIVAIAPAQTPTMQSESRNFGSRYTIDFTHTENELRSIVDLGGKVQSVFRSPLTEVIKVAQQMRELSDSPVAREAQRIRELSDSPMTREAQRIQKLFDSPIVRDVQRIQKLLGPQREDTTQDQVEDDDTDTLGDFLPGAAIIDSFSLPGREAILSNLITLIKSRSPAVLIGPRRAGKTSILNALTLRLMATEHVVYHVTLEGKNIVTADDLAFILDPSLESDGHPAKTLQARLKESSSVLLIDEIANLISADHTAFAWLRAVGQEKTSVVLVGSSWDWKQVVDHAAAVTPGSSFGNDVTPVHLGPLTEADALEFLETTAPEDVPISPDGTGKWILELCGTWPFYLQVMGYAIVQAVRIGNRKALVEKIGVSDLYESRLLADRDVGYFGTRWAELPERARKVLWQIRTSADKQPPRVRELAPEDRKILRATGMVDTREQWVEDKPFFDWIRRIADESVGNAS